MQMGALLLVKGRAAARTWGRDEGQMELKINNIDLLGDARDKYITKLNLKVDADRVDDALTRELGQLLKASPGKCKVTVQLVSAQENMALEAASKGFSVGLTEDLIRSLDGLTDVSYTLN